MLTDVLQTAIKDFDINLSETQLRQFEIYYNMLVEWNKKINLTAITAPEDVAVKHFADCLELFNYINIPKSAKVIDVGTGAGFPGLVMKIARPDIQLTLLDSLNKRLVFLRGVLDKIGLDAEIVHSRGEDGAHHAEYREQYDFAVSRAVARLNVLAEYTLGYVKTGGCLAALKGPAADEEIADSKKALGILGAKLGNKYEFELPLLKEKRNILLIKKIKAMSEKYPRSSGKIKSNPL